MRRRLLGLHLVAALLAAFVLTHPALSATVPAGIDDDGALVPYPIGNSLLYCDGSDGALSVTGTYTAARDICATTVTVVSGGVIITNGARIFARTSISVAAGGAIRANGAGGIGTAGGFPSGSMALCAGRPGGNGGVAAAGSPGISAPTSIGGSGGNGGSATLSLAGGAGGAAAAAAAQYGSLRLFTTATLGHYIGASTLQCVVGGGGGGGGSGQVALSQGGAGGAGGGVIMLASPTITNSGAIEARGGAGANGTGVSVAAGGGGGGGGAVITVGAYTGNAPDVAGGSAGTSIGTPFAAPQSGQAGSWLRVGP